jgi:hypothetical protein
MELLITQSVREQTARIRAPGALGVAQARELRGGRDQSCPPFGGVEVVGELANGGVVERGLAVEVAAGGEHEQRTADGGVPFLVGERNVLSRDERGDDEVDVSQTVYSSAIASASSRIAMPSSISSRVIVSGGQTMTTFQCVIR